MKGKKILKVVGIVLLMAMLLCVGVFAFRGGFNDILGKDRNEKNLIQLDSGYIKTQNTNRGVEIDVNDNGVIKLSGKATSDYSVNVASVKLPAGTYTISGLDEPDVNRLWMYVKYSGGEAIAGTEDATFTLNAEETVTVILSWAEDYNFNIFTENKICPVIVEGNTPGDFYA